MDGKCFKSKVITSQFDKQSSTRRHLPGLNPLDINLQVLTQSSDLSDKLQQVLL